MAMADDNDMIYVTVPYYCYKISCIAQSSIAHLPALTEQKKVTVRYST